MPTALGRPVFTSGTARGGTNLLAQILSVNKDVALASDPYLPLFRQFRNAAVRLSNDTEVREALDPDAPIDDYYFSPVKLRTMREIQAASLDMTYDQSQYADLLRALQQRTSLSSTDLVPYLPSLTGRTFLEMFDNGLRIIAKAREAEACRWVGFNENWAVDFFVPLARAFPEARFIIILRDPRAAIASALREPDRTRVPHVLSFARCWRKYVAFVHHLKADTIIGNRLFVIAYEDLVREPERWVRSISDFLEITFGPAMLDTNNFRRADGGMWRGNSHMGGSASGIYTSSIDAWRSYLPQEIVETVELVCEPEMRLLGYAPSENSGLSFPSGGALRFIAEDCAQCQGWRTDFGNIERDVGSEMFRKAVLFDYLGNSDDELIQRCFLFKEAYQALRGTKDPTQNLSVTGASGND